MWLNKLYERHPGRSATSGRARPSAAPRRGLRLRLEQLEDRTMPSNFTAASVSDLIADINAANQNAESDTITLAAGKVFTLTQVNNTTGGATGLPVIAATENLTIIGNGDIIERSTVAGTPPFRLFDVGSALTLENLTLQGGLALGLTFNASAIGGAVLNGGTLNLDGVIVQNNTAQGFNVNGPGPWEYGGNAEGGGLWSYGSLTVTNCIIANNAAIAGRGGDGAIDLSLGVLLPGAGGGLACGGGLVVAGGSAMISNSTITANTAQGGDGGDGYKSMGVSSDGGLGGSSLGGGLCVELGTVELHNVSITQNRAQGGAGGQSGGGGSSHGERNSGDGGGISIFYYGFVYLDTFSLDHVRHNHADFTPEIFGSYLVIP
jgi:hypothetical protein